jgi:pyruvate dehydrogenase E1 component
VPDELKVTIQPEMATQTGFGALLNEIARATTPLASRIVTTSPDVTVSTNLGPWVNRRGLFAREALADTFKSERIPSTFNWEFSPKGQHIELGIAEMNLFGALSALGLSHAINGERLLPIGTLYDPFIARGLDGLNYACYQDARFILVATPSGLTLAPEGGAHQSIAEPLIGIAQDRLLSMSLPSFSASRSTTFSAAAKVRKTASRPSATGCATRSAARSICACRRGPSNRCSAR